MRQFLQQTLSSAIGTIIGLFLFFGLGTASLILLIVLIAIASQGESSSPIKANSVLVFDLARQIADTRPPSTLGETLLEESDRPLSLRQVLNAIDAAADDSQISGIFLDASGGSVGAGFASRQEIRRALLEFRETGKPVIAYDTSWGESDYYLASTADEIIVNPLGSLELNGFGSSQLFFAGALEKYGIGVQVVRVGRYKSAVEPFTRQNLSSENRQQLNALLGDLWGEFLQAVGESRSLTPDRLQAIADTRGILSPSEAVEVGLIDEIAHFDTVIERLKEVANARSGADSFPEISLSRYIQVSAQNASLTEGGSDRIAVVYAEGGIVNGEGDIQNVGGDRYAEIFRDLRDDNRVKAIVLRINSPGGSAIASDIILQAIQLTRDRKPVVVSMGDIAASGGYWIAMGGQQIFAEPTTITGSIGVFGLRPNVQELANENGLTWDGVQTGRFAGINAISRPLTEAELAILQRQTDRIYDRFLETVAESRPNLEKAEVADYAEGRVWSGKAAQELGLVDELGGLDAAIAFAASSADLNTWSVEEYPRLRSFEVRLLERLGSRLRRPSANSIDPVHAEVKRLRSTFETLQQLDDPQGIYARLPFYFYVE